MVAKAGTIPHTEQEITAMEAAVKHAYKALNEAAINSEQHANNQGKAKFFDDAQGVYTEQVTKLNKAKLANSDWAIKVALGTNLQKIEGANFEDATGCPTFTAGELALFPEDVRDMIDMTEVNVPGGGKGYKFKEAVWNPAGADTKADDRMKALEKVGEKLKAENARRQKVVDDPESAPQADQMIDIPLELQPHFEGKKAIRFGDIASKEDLALLMKAQQEGRFDAYGFGAVGLLRFLYNRNPQMAQAALNKVGEAAPAGLGRVFDMIDREGAKNRLALQKAAIIAAGGQAGGRRNMRRRTMNRKNAKRSTRRRRNTRRNY